MDGRKLPGHGPDDEGFHEDGYDESQRAEILETTQDGPRDGMLQSDLVPDLGDDILDDEDAEEDPDEI